MAATFGLPDDEIDRLLSEAEARLSGNGSLDAVAVVGAAAAAAKTPATIVAPPAPTAGEQTSVPEKKSEKLTVRVPQLPQKNKGPKDTLGADWFNLPRTNLTPELKRDLQALRMRDVAAMGKQFFKKDSRKDLIPEYSQVGTIIAGATDGVNSRLTRKEKKRTIVEEILASENVDKLKSKYQDIQEKKRSGKKGHYKKLVAGRRKRNGDQSHLLRTKHSVLADLIDNNPGQHGAKNSAERFEVLHSTSTVVEGHAEMNPPRLIRPLRPFLQGQLPLTAPRSAAVGIPRASTQLRTYASVEVPSTGEKSSATPPAQNAKSDKPAVSRMPRALEALYLKPLRREVEYGVPSCNLQLRSYSVRNLEFFCDFALRAAYYLGLPAFGPVPLPRKVQRWTVPKSTFIFKKSQENFERITLRRMIQIRDGNPETVQLWLAFLQKHAYYGIGMKANVWEFSKLGVGKEMDKNLEQTEKLMEDKWEHLSYVERRPEFQKKKDRGPREQLPPAEDMEAFLASERRKIAGGR
ncbi:Fcf2 pre-rRNA processing-domain-containing protein [Chaetomium tenue]|uniref:Fcf2 pre-rRNA processing-domain-containing protein n=1 Tax=Chaetomium tenue TaxID=1854479 RepID=A0ACB7PBE1_9PEZI|nr:Fcf2 pre-rRNA processing-domain-containing protein [Chaetomium globosum]